MIGLPEIIAGVIAISLNAYALTGGADFGGGVWDLLATGPRRDRQRELIAESIAPIWEANHVWLIVVIVVLFTAFPAAFGMLGIVLHIPITVLLIGIMMRGSAFVFRSYGPQGRGRNVWGTTFAIASVVTPFFLGIVIGAVVSGRVAEAATRLGSTTFVDVFIRSWADTIPVAVGVFALVLFAFLAATYLTVEAEDDALREDFRKRALVAAAAVIVSGAVVDIPVVLIVQAAATMAAAIAFGALWVRRYRVARVAAAAEVSFVLWGWLFAQYPYVIPPALTIREAAAPAVTLRLLAIGLAAGAVVLLPSLHYMLRVFKTKRPTSSNF
ncbi:MAG TPA: cytochrome d ubiquinol oxidase subunit II [Vicinamibacterales bacterium]|jgi:cytochrome d ubiquinol oxidase subunit II|nr:cytochrome d ubiquinol oxidase subunit II [Vicinamibacterales bacterium]